MFVMGSPVVCESVCVFVWVSVVRCVFVVVYLFVGGFLVVCMKGCLSVVRSVCIVT